MAKIKHINVVDYDSEISYDQFDLVKVNSGSIDYYFVSVADGSLGNLTVTGDESLLSNDYWKRFDDKSIDFFSIWNPDYSSVLEDEANLNKVEFGDGYRQISETGLINHSINFSVSFKNRSTKEAKSLLAFLEYKGGYFYISATIPSFDGARKFICSSWNHVFEGFNTHSIDFVFSEVFDEDNGEEFDFNEVSHLFVGSVPLPAVPPAPPDPLEPPEPEPPPPYSTSSGLPEGLGAVSHWSADNINNYVSSDGRIHVLSDYISGKNLLPNTSEYSSPSIENYAVSNASTDGEFKNRRSAIYFSGKSGECLRTDYNLLAPKYDLRCTFWVLAKSNIKYDGNRGIITLLDVSGDVSTRRFYMYQNTINGGEGYMATGVEYYNSKFIGAPIYYQSWHFLCITRTEERNNGYLDGEYVGGLEEDITPWSDTPNSYILLGGGGGKNIMNKPIYSDSLGGFYPNRNLNIGSYEGYIAEAGIHNRVLTGIEITSIKSYLESKYGITL